LIGADLQQETLLDHGLGRVELGSRRLAQRLRGGTEADGVLGATVQGMFSLAGGLPSTIKTKRYARGPAFRACGEEVIKASWVAFVLLPNAPADASEHVVFMVRTAKGWRVWYEWNPQNPKGAVVDV